MQVAITYGRTRGMTILSKTILARLSGTSHIPPPLPFWTWSKESNAMGLANTCLRRCGDLGPNSKSKTAHRPCRHDPLFPPLPLLPLPVSPSRLVSSTLSSLAQQTRPLYENPHLLTRHHATKSVLPLCVQRLVARLAGSLRGTRLLHSPTPHRLPRKLGTPPL